MKVLYLDLETSPNLGWFWHGKYEVGIIAVKKPWELLCFSYKWIGDGSIYWRGRTDYADLTDESLVKSLWALLDEADIVIAHNGDQFDLKMASTKFVEYRLGEPSPYETIDTKKIAKRNFRFNSNSLEDLAIFFKLGVKTSHSGKDLWFRCMGPNYTCLDGDAEAWATMKEYNIQDVNLLEGVYLIMRGHQKGKGKSSLALANNNIHACYACGEFSFKRHPRRLMKGGWKVRIQCIKCGKWDAINESLAEVLFTP